MIGVTCYCQFKAPHASSYPPKLCSLLFELDQQCHMWSCFLAHLSRRLIGELIVYQWLRRPSSVRRPSVHPSTFSNIFSSETTGPIELIYFIWRLLRMGERKFVQMVLVTWPRWPPRPYMVKTLKNLLLQNQKADDLGTWYVALGLWGLPSLFKWWS